MAEFDGIMKVNVQGMFNCVLAEINAMKDQEPRRVSTRDPCRGVIRGVIVNMASIASYTAFPADSLYSTSKHAVLGLTKNAGELSDLVGLGVRH